MKLDTRTPTGSAMFHMMALLAELKRGLISERTRTGNKAAQRRGVKCGREPSLAPRQITHAREQIDGGKAPRAVAALLNAGGTTLWRTLKRQAG